MTVPHGFDKYHEKDDILLLQKIIYGLNQVVIVAKELSSALRNRQPKEHCSSLNKLQVNWWKAIGHLDKLGQL